METDAARRLIPTRATIAYGTEKVNLFFPAEHPADTYDRALELLGRHLGAFERQERQLEGALDELIRGLKE